MSSFLNRLLSLSIFGSMLACVLFLLKPLIKDKVSKAVSYYLWLLVLFRLCLPFGVSLPIAQAWSPVPAGGTEKAYNAYNESYTAQDGAAISEQAGNGNMQTSLSVQGPIKQAAADSPEKPENGGESSSNGDTSDGAIFAAAAVWLKAPFFWFAVWALGFVFFICLHALGYLRFSGIIRRAAAEPDEEDLAVYREFRESRLARFVNCGFAKTPMLLGLMRPLVVVPETAYSKSGKADCLRDILRHELTHCRRRDILYKWFAAAVCCLHWFNPLIWAAGREISRACELACDEAAIRGLSPSQRRRYCETLLDMAAKQTLAPGMLATTMCVEKVQLKERLASIMNSKTKSRAAAMLSAVLVLLLAGCAAVNGVGKADKSSPEPDAAIYEKYGMQIAIPKEYADRLLVFTEPKYEAFKDSFLISVYEKQSYEESRADWGDEAASGFLFGICRYTRAQYESYLCSDGSGLSFFAKDDNYYYGHTYATDVQFYRSDIDNYTEESLAPWNELLEQVDGILSDFISRNSLTAYSDDEFWSRAFTYDSEHLYVTYYPYYAVNGGKNSPYTLVLSQPAKQGEGGVWCVERWYDNEYGNLYYYFPSWNGNTDLPADEYYARLQKDCDGGLKPELLDPIKAAMEFAKDYFGHTPVDGSFEYLEGEPAGNVLDLCLKVFDDIGVLQAASYDNGVITEKPEYAVPDYRKPFSNYARSSLYAYIWLKAEEPSVKSGNVVFCHSADGKNTLSFYQQDGLLCVSVNGETQWFQTAYPYSSNSPYDRMYGYYDEASRYTSGKS